MLTPVDIEKMEFKKVALGYSPDEVDNFLDRVIMDFEVLYKENIKLNDKINVLDDAIKYYKGLEDTIRNSIILAEKTAAETKNNATQASDQIIKQARMKASDILQEANKQLYDIEQEVLKLNNEYNTFRTKLKHLLNCEMEILENTEQDFERVVENTQKFEPLELEEEDLEVSATDEDDEVILPFDADEE